MTTILDDIDQKTIEELRRMYKDYVAAETLELKTLGRTRQTLAVIRAEIALREARMLCAEDAAEGAK